MNPFRYIIYFFTYLLQILERLNAESKDDYVQLTESRKRQLRG